MRHDVEIIIKKLYPLVKKAITPAFITKYKRLLGEFLQARHESLYDTSPCDRIYFSPDDSDAIFNIIKIKQSDIKEILSQTYFYPIANFHPAYAKDETTALLMCILRYFLIEKKDNRLMELALLHLSFSGKFYPSVHYGSFPIAPSENRHIMDFVVNEKLTDQFDIRKHGSLINAIKNRSLTWITTYNSRFKSFDDEDYVYLIQQLRDRMKSFMSNIAEVFYDVYEHKDQYMSYNSDDIGEEKYRLADNNSLRMERYIENTMNELVTKSLDPVLVKKATNASVGYDELRSILSSIIDTKENIPVIKEFITIIVSEYYNDSKYKDLTSLEFLSKSLAPKPNTKNEKIKRQMSILENWLNEESPAYRRRRKRLATKLGYHKAVLSYFVLYIQKTAKGGH